MTQIGTDVLTWFSPSPGFLLTWVPHSEHVPIGTPADRDHKPKAATPDEQEMT